MRGEGKEREQQVNGERERPFQTADRHKARPTKRETEERENFSQE